MTGSRVIVDANVLVALADARDKWHRLALSLRDALVAAQARMVYFDCVINEAISVIGRRAEEQNRSDQFDDLLDRVVQQVPLDSITWVSGESERLFSEILDLCRQHGGRLNFNDSLLALLCGEREIRYVASFDGDFDALPGLTRLSDPARILAMLGAQGQE